MRDERGEPVLTLGVTDPLAGYKKMYPYWGIFLYFAVVGLTIITVFWLRALDPITTIVSIVIVVLLAIMGFSFIRRNMGRSVRPIQIYQNGISFHVYPVDLMHHHRRFVPKEDIKSVSVRYADERKADLREQRTSHFTVHTKDASYFSGERKDDDVRRAVQWMKDQWGTPIENSVPA